MLASCAPQSSGKIAGGYGVSTRPEESKARIESASDELRSDPQALLDAQTLRSLESAEARYRGLVTSGGWPAVPTGPSFRPGDGDPRAEVLARRLSVSSDLPRGSGARPTTSEFAVALERFQSRHGLRPTGIADTLTIEALNVTAESRLAQLRANTARIRDLTQSMASSKRYVLVNIPAFQLEAVEGGQVVQRHRVIVGRVERPSPSVKTYQFLSVLARPRERGPA
jgi:L,D-transpeptidase YcbB